MLDELKAVCLSEILVIHEYFVPVIFVLSVGNESLFSLALFSSTSLSFL